jgi:7-carboxy-7-deazaguanine synthase
MKTIKVAEIFYSLQGEGLYLGTPSIFLRTFGCNFTCGGFSMPRGESSIERFGVDPANYKKYEDLPLVHTGCDSYASWDPRFKDFSPKLEIPAIVDRIQALLPGGKFSQDKHLIITGGEPLLGWQKSYPALFDEFLERDMGLTHLTFETNGTQPLSLELENALFNIPKVIFSISSKLPSSGHNFAEAIKRDVVKQYVECSSNAYFKWVITSPDDYEDILLALSLYAPIDIPVYLMAAGGTTEHYDINKKWVAELAKQKGFRYSPRLQIDLWKNSWGT